MTKYSTYNNYEKYINVIMEDLGLPKDKVIIKWVFRKYKSMGGDAILYNTVGKNGERYGRVRIDNRQTHKDTLKIIMHELRHIQQFYSGKLSKGNNHEIITARGKVKYIFGREWDNVWYKHVKLSRSGQGSPEYYALPWEKDARFYEKDVNRLFPKNVIVKMHVGNVGKVKFYKTEG